MINEFKITEADWKVWKALRLRAIDKYCEETFSQLQALIDNKDRVHDRHRRLYQLVTERDDLIEQLFDPLTRNRALFQLPNLYRLGLISAEEISLFSDELQEYLNDWKEL